MATLVFSTVGTMFGGPIGGAIGALIGRQVDSALFGPPSRQGPRLKELQVTTSSYGQPLARHFGRMRVAGQMIWATDLVEHSESQGGGKGSPSITTYSYSANFAVALASRPILDIGRIWADGKLMRGEAGDLKVGGTMRLYRGTGNEPADPLIAASEGPGHCSAHRDLAYVVFEGLDLSEFYNHIPALTFEVIADEGFTLRDIVGELVEDIDAEVPLEGLIGFSSEGSLNESLAMLDPVLPLDADVAGERLVIARQRSQQGPIPLSEAAVATADDEFGANTGYARRREASPDQPLRQLRYFDLDRDYLPGLQRATDQPAPGEPRTIDLPAALDATSARDLIERAARRSEWMRDRIAWRTSELDPAVAPGALVTLPTVEGRWRVLEWEWRETGIELTLERVLPTGADTALPSAVDPGRIIAPGDNPLSATRLLAFELPWDGVSGSADRVAPFAAVSSGSLGWKGAALYCDAGDGQLQPLGPSGRARSLLGTATSALPPASTLVLDRTSSVTVTLVDPTMQLNSVGSRQLAMGANLALIGEELVQFASATPQGAGTWLLKGLLRGRGGTEAAIAGHQAGEGFVLLDGKAKSLDPTLISSGSSSSIVAIGPGDPDPVSAPMLLAGLTLRPLSPVHPRAKAAPDGALQCRWTRRARGNWQWKDGIDAPLVEESESYIVTIGPLEAPTMTWLTTSAEIVIPAAVIAQLAIDAPGQALCVRQRGTHAVSDPLLLATLP